VLTQAAGNGFRVGVVGMGYEVQKGEGRGGAKVKQGEVEVKGRRKKKKMMEVTYICRSPPKKAATYYFVWVWVLINWF
jgi:hypothetical protein